MPLKDGQRGVLQGGDLGGLQQVVELRSHGRSTCFWRYSIVASAGRAARGPRRAGEAPCSLAIVTS